jgi:molecular chaperone DnaJ
VANTSRDYYEILGLDRDCDFALLKKTYRRLALEFHPDRNPSEQAAFQFREIQEAYEVLSDPEKRSLYDQFGHAGLRAQAGAGGFSGGMDDIFGGFQSIFDDFFGGSRRQKVSRGADLGYRLKISLEEAVLGAEKKIEIKRHRLCKICDGKKVAPGSLIEACPTCQGQGRIRRQQGFFVMAQDCPQCAGTGQLIKNPCSNCKASGVEKEKASLDVKIPQGVDSGMRLRVSGEGEISASGGPRGDLYVELELEEHEIFERDGSSLYTSLSIPYTLAIFGGEIEVPIIGGTRKIELKPVKEIPFALSLEGEGVPDLNTKKRAALFIELHIEIPEKLSPKAKDLLSQLKDEIQKNPPALKKKKKKRTLFGFEI